MRWRSAGIVTAKNTWGVGNRLLQRETQNATYGYRYNGHGDIIALTDASGSVVEDYAYDPYGNAVEDGEDAAGYTWSADAETAQVDNPFRYCGEYYDEETGFYYLRARYYDPKLGRFTQEDTARSGLNWYVYCTNNPIFFIDPWGLKEVQIREIAEQYGGTVTWDPETNTAYVSFGSAGTKSYRATIKSDNHMYVDDKEFADEWGIEDSIRAYSSDLGGFAVYTIFNTGYGLFGPKYYERFSVCGKEIDYYKTEHNNYNVFSLTGKKERQTVQISHPTYDERVFYNGGWQEDASVIFGNMGGIWPLFQLATALPLDAGLEGNDIKIYKNGENSVMYNAEYYVDKESKKLKLRSYIGPLEDIYTA